MQNKIGNKWSEISKNLQGRTENQVKNRYKGLISKRNTKRKKPSNEKIDENIMDDYIKSVAVNNKYKRTYENYQKSNDEYNFPFFFDDNFYKNSSTITSTNSSGVLSNSVTVSLQNYIPELYQHPLGWLNTNDYSLISYPSFNSNINYPVNIGSSLQDNELELQRLMISNSNTQSSFINEDLEYSARDINNPYAHQPRSINENSLLVENLLKTIFLIESENQFLSINEGIKSIPEINNL